MVGVLGCMAERLKERLLDTERLADIVAGPDAYRDLPLLIEAVQARVACFPAETGHLPQHLCCTSMLWSQQLQAAALMMMTCLRQLIWTHAQRSADWNSLQPSLTPLPSTSVHGKYKLQTECIVL